MIQRALGSFLFLVLVGSSVSGSSDLIITAEPGDDITLPCGDPNINQVLVLEWTRSDLQEDEYVFLYREKRVDLEAQDESFQNRVFLKNDQMKDGDLSVVLENLKINDTGRYECRAVNEDDPQREKKLISTIHLMVSPPPPLPPLPLPPPPDLNISAESGDDIILPCRDPNINQDSVLNWTRTDLQEDEYVTFRMNNSAVSEGRPESFHNRVFLNNSQMKDGDLSVVLKNVEIEDSGIYECRVKLRNDPTREWKLIAIINLQVSPPSGHDRLGLMAASVLVVLVLLPVVLWISKKKKIFNPKFHQASES